MSSNTGEDDTNGDEQPLTIEVRLQRRPEKTCRKNPLGKKQEIWLGTMAHAPAIDSLSYGSKNFFAEAFQITSRFVLAKKNLSLGALQH